jgi:hypothetical protein
VIGRSFAINLPVGPGCLAFTPATVGPAGPRRRLAFMAVGAAGLLGAVLTVLGLPAHPR